MRISAIVPAAGKSRRLGGRLAKVLRPLGGKPLIGHTLVNLGRAFHFQEVIVAAQPRQFGELKRLFGRLGLSRTRVVTGGSTRAASVKNAVLAVSASSDWVLIHDAARPLVRPETVKAVVAAAEKTGAAICALAVTSTVKRADARKKIIQGTADRSSLFLAQTPQVFKKKLLLGRYLRLGAKALRATDEAALFDGSGVRVAIVAGDAANIKITTPDDLDLFHFYKRKAGRRAHRHRV